MSESKAAQIVAAIAARFQSAIVGDGGATYWLTPDIVGRVPGFTSECLDASRTTVITLSPDAPDLVEGLTFTTMKAQVLVHLAMATKFTEAQTDALHPPAVHRELLQDRLLRDVETAIGTDNTVGGLALWSRVVERDKSPARTYCEGWAIAYASVLVEYAYTEGQP